MYNYKYSQDCPKLCICLSDELSGIITPSRNTNSFVVLPSKFPINPRVWFLNSSGSMTTNDRRPNRIDTSTLIPDANVTVTLVSEGLSIRVALLELMSVLFIAVFVRVLLTSSPSTRTLREFSSISIWKKKRAIIKICVNETSSTVAWSYQNYLNKSSLHCI